MKIEAAVLKSLSVSIVLAHNHTNGNLKSGKADEELTKKIMEAGKYHDITVLDHIIIATE